MFKKISIILFIFIFSGNVYGIHIKKSSIELHNDIKNIRYSYFSSVPILKYDKFELIGDNNNVCGCATILKNPNYNEWTREDSIDPLNYWRKKRNKVNKNLSHKPFYILNEITTNSDAPKGSGKSLLLAILNYYKNCWIGLTAFPHGEKAMDLNFLVLFYTRYGFRSLNSKDKSIQGENMRMCMFIDDKGVTYSGSKENLLDLKISN